MPFVLALVLACALAAPAVSAAAGFEQRFAAAVTRVERGEHAAAITAFEELVRDYPQRPEPMNNLATELARQGDLVRARELLERALGTHPSYATAHDNLRTVYAALASDAYRKALPVGTPATAAPTLALIARVEPDPRVVGAAPVAGTAIVATAPRLIAGSAPTPISTATAASASSQAPGAGPSPATVRDEGSAELRAAAAAFDAVAAWARAWSAQDVNAYLAAYAPSFAPPDGMSRPAWEALRTARVRAPKQIAVTLQDRDLVFDSNIDRAAISFMQTYRSDRFNGSGWKTLGLQREGARWLIISERNGR